MASSRSSCPTCLLAVQGLALLHLCGRPFVGTSRQIFRTIVGGGTNSDAVSNECPCVKGKLNPSPTSSFSAPSHAECCITCMVMDVPPLVLESRGEMQQGWFWCNLLLLGGSWIIW